MTQAYKELAMEDEIVARLQNQGWVYEEGSAARYDKQRALFPEDVFAWLETTQPDELAKIVKPGVGPAAQTKAKDGILNALTETLSNVAGGGGTLTVLRKGFRRVSARFQMVQAKPTETMNPKTVQDYQRNVLRVVRQVHYSITNPNKSIDLVLFCNGIPVATIELKTEFTQSVVRGQVQYKNDRDPGADGKDVLLAWGKRALVHFVVTDNEVSMTTDLKGAKTTFLPFNQGDGTGKGNPLNPDGARTEYFWRDVLNKDAFLTILTKFIVVRTDEKPNPVTGKTEKSTSLRFPRFHQWDAVEKIVARVSEVGVGERYLIEHSAGSGKTDTIVWTAFRLAALHRDNKKVFDSVIVVTDRNVLDKQMSTAMRQLDPHHAQMVRIDGAGGSKSGELADALRLKTPIIVVTIQTAPFALKYLREQADSSGGQYAVIADEAHSSQTGTAAAKLKTVLSPNEQADVEDGGEIDAQAMLAAELPQRAETPNLTYLAFTATPKEKTLELFGTPDYDDLDDNGEPLPKPFHRYTMRQAIEEGFILDVLQNYTEYKVAYELGLKAADDDVESVDKEAARKAAHRWVQLHEHNITQKVDIIVRHFRENIAGLLGGTAKAMIVTSSRKHALRYYKAVERYVAKHGYDDVHALVAFSGKVIVSGDDTDIAPDELLGVGEYTEVGVNIGAKGKPLDEVLNGPAYQVMIVANKYQVGFDQPLLCAMYVDKRLDGVMAVQTLSRLNRTWAGKDRVYVLDFVNDTDDILAAFKPYYEGAVIEKRTDPDLPNRLAVQLDAVGLDRIYTHDEIETAAIAATDPQATHSALVSAIDPGAKRFLDLLRTAREAKDDEETQRLDGFRSNLNNYVKAYDFLSQIIPYDLEMENRSIYYRLLAKRLQDERVGVVVEIDHITLAKYKVEKKATKTLNLSTGEATPLTPLAEMGTAAARERDMAHWSEIIDAINSLFADSGLSADDVVPEIEGVLRDAKKDPILVAKAKANTDSDFNADSTVVTEVLSKFIDRRERSEEIINALLKEHNMETFANLLALLGFREYLATVDYSFPPADVTIELAPDAQHLEMKGLVGHSGGIGSASARDRGVGD